MLVCHACTHENRLLEIHYSSILATRKPKQRELSVARSRFLVNHEFTLKILPYAETAETVIKSMLGRYLHEISETAYHSIRI